MNFPIELGKRRHYFNFALRIYSVKTKAETIIERQTEKNRQSKRSYVKKKKIQIFEGIERKQEQKDHQIQPMQQVCKT